MKLFDYKSYRIAICILLLNHNILFSQQSPTSFSQQSPTSDFLGNATNETKGNSKLDPVYVGAKMPNIPINLWGDKKIVNFAEFKGKLVILDFWSTWCLSCISYFPKLDSIQKKFGDRIQIILVNSLSTGDDKHRVTKFFEKREINPDILVTVEDSLIEQLFPHQSIPHYAWISTDGKVNAITSGAEVTAENIEAMLNGEESLRLSQKNDYFYNELPLLPVHNFLIDDNFPMYQFFRRGKIQGMETISMERYQLEKAMGNNLNFIHRGKLIMNTPLLEMYKEALQFNPDFLKEFNENRLLLDVVDSSELIFNPERSTKNEWEANNLYNYDLVVPASEIDSEYIYLLRDLNKYSNYYGRIEKRIVKVYNLKRTSSIDKLRTIGGRPDYKLYNDLPKKHIKNLPISSLVRALNFSIPSIKRPVIDQSNYKNNIDIEFDIDLRNLKAVIMVLNNYGLNLVEDEQSMDMFVITRKTKPSK
jgi:thiol-disulfide isomerase/thioredoxin